MGNIICLAILVSDTALFLFLSAVVVTVVNICTKKSEVHSVLF